MSKNNNSIEKIFDLVKKNKLIKDALMEQIFNDYEICVDAKLISNSDYEKCLKCKKTGKERKIVMYKIFLWDTFYTGNIATVWICAKCFDDELGNKQFQERLEDNIEVE